MPSLSCLVTFLATAATFMSAVSSVGICDTCSHLVAMKDDLSEQEFRDHASWIQNLTGHVSSDPSAPGSSHRQFSIGSFKGYSGAFTSEQIAEIRSHHHVKSVEENFPVTAISMPSSQSPMIDQTDTQWPLRQISSKDQNSPNYASKAEAGEGTTVFVLDTGIEIEHEELEGRATWGVNTLDDIKSDDTGHGTHVAGIIGSRTYGVAKKTQMVGVRVLGGPAADGCSCSIIPGLAWAVNEIKTNSSLQNKSVINLSFGVHPANLTQGVTDVFAQAFAAAFDVLPSLVVVAAAGNDDSGDLVLPAALPRVCAVGSTDLHSRKSSFSNFGPRVDVRAPGSGIISLGTEHMTPTKATSGTPMAAPFISGLAAYLISLSSSPEEQKDICKMVKEETIKNLDLFSASDHGTDTTNKFAYNGKDQQLRKRGPARQTKKDLSTTDITELGAFNMTGIQQLPCPATDSLSKYPAQLKAVTAHAMAAKSAPDGAPTIV
ncbi:MAG: Secreted subtilisin-like serine protease sub4 [Stictis urceolatum]|nr:Secreted subtilisin-like serine protease sub4 [Stictis urceolata]